MKAPPTLMLLPGLMCDALVWEQQVAGLQGKAHCLIPDWGMLSSLTAMAQQVLKSSPTERFSLAGHSMGGRIALEVMRLAPHRVERLALLDTGTHPLAFGEAGATERSKRMALLAMARSEGMRAMGTHWAHGMVHPQQLDTPLFHAILDMIERSSPAQFEAQINALLMRPDAASTLTAVRCPTLIVCGRQDGWSTPAQHQAMHELLPASVVQIVESCGHMCTLEQPGVITQALSDWLSAV